MKNPLWIINSTFAVLLCVLCITMLLMRSPTPRRDSIYPQNVTRIQQGAPLPNPVRIYENDLFRTFVRPQEAEKTPGEEVIVVPAPPQPKSFMKKPQRLPEFLPPLEVELKGVIFDTNSLYSRAIIMDRKSGKEELYKIGDAVGDAHLIYVGKNKAIFVRSNGQQETLFVTAEAAQKDSIYTPSQISTAIEQLDETNYIVNTDQFSKEINNLAQFIEMLDITTAFEKSRSIGCRVGKLAPRSIGPALGLRYGDIITSINDIPTTSTSDRVKIYKMIENMESNQQVVVSILRNGMPRQFTYTLKQKPSKKTPEEQKHQRWPAGTPLPEEARSAMRNDPKIAEINQQTLAQAQTNNAVADIFKKNDKKAMVDYGGRNAFLQR